MKFFRPYNSSKGTEPKENESNKEKDVIKEKIIVKIKESYKICLKKNQNYQNTSSTSS